MTARVFLGIGYMLAAMTCLVAWRYDLRRTLASERQRKSAFWLVVGLLLGILGIVRATDLAKSAEDASRRFVEAEGWYQERRPAQLVVVIVLLALWAWAALFALRRRRDDRRSRDTLMTVIVLASLIVLGAVRTVSFHYADSILSRTTVLGTTAGNLLEVAGIGLIILLAARAAVAHSDRSLVGTRAARARIRVRAGATTICPPWTSSVDRSFIGPRRWAAGGAQRASAGGDNGSRSTINRPIRRARRS